MPMSPRSRRGKASRSCCSICGPVSEAGSSAMLTIERVEAFAIRSDLDLALWDLKGKVIGRPVWELIGGPARPHVDCYATGNDTDWHMELGFRATKLACPHGPADGLAGLDANEALVARARELIGPD